MSSLPRVGRCPALAPQRCWIRCSTRRRELRQSLSKRSPSISNVIPRTNFSQPSQTALLPILRKPSRRAAEASSATLNAQYTAEASKRSTRLEEDWGLRRLCLGRVPEPFEAVEDQVEPELECAFVS